MGVCRATHGESNEKENVYRMKWELDLCRELGA